MESQIQCVGSVTTLEPRKVLELSSKEYLQGSNLYYLESQFITRERESLAIIGISFDDIYLLDKMYLLCKALPYYQIIAQKPLVDSRSPFSMKSQAAQTLADSSTSSRNDSHSAHTASKDDFVMQNESNHYKSNFHAGREIFNRNKYGTNSQGKEFCNASAYQQNNNGIRDINEGGSYQSNKHYLKERGHQTNFPISKMIDKNEGFQRCPHTSNQENGLKTRSNKCLNGFKSENGTSRPPQVIQNGQRTTGQYKYGNKVENLEDDASICSETSVKRNLKIGNFSNQVIQDHENPHLTACEKPNKANSHCEVSIVRDHPAPLLNNTFPSTDEAPAITVETEKSPLNTLPDTKVAPGIVVEIEKSPLNTLPATKIVPTAQTEKSPLNTLPATKKAPGIVVETEKSPLNTLPTTKIVPTVQTEKYPLLPATEVVPAITVQSNKSVPGPTETYEVVFGDKQQNNYFVIKQKDLTALDAMEMKLAQETLQIWSDQCEDKKVVVVCDGRHYRGIITQNNTKIKLVDVGWFLTFDNRNSSNVFVLPEKFRTIKPLAFPVNIDDAHHISRNTRCTIDETGLFDEKVKRVKVKQVSAVISDVPSKCDNVSKQSLSSQQVSRLTLNTPLSVIYILREDGNPENHFVQDTKYASVYDTWQELANEQNNLNSMPQLGDLCLAMAEGEWVRTKVVALEPLTVYHFDYGSSEVVGKFEELKFTPKVMSTLAPLAYKIKFFNVKNNEKAYEFGNQFQITPIDFFNDVYTVLKDDETPLEPLFENISVKAIREATQVHKTQENATTSKSADYKYKSAAINENSVELNKQIEVMYLQDDKNNRNHIWVQTSGFAEPMLIWQEKCDSSKATFNHGTAQPGDFCIKMYDEFWCRAKILSINPLILFYIDFGNVEDVENISQIKPLPEELACLKPLALKVQYYDDDENRQPMEYGDLFFITPTQLKNDVYIVLKGNENLLTTTVKETQRIRYDFKDCAISKPSVLELNKPVEVGFVENDIHDPSHKWVQESKFYEFLKNWTEISNALTTKFVSEPTVGEYCIILYEDTWCRGQIVNVEPLTIFCVDYGNECVIQNHSEIKPLPTQLSLEKPFAHKIQFFNKANADVTYNFADLFTITPIEVIGSVLIVLKGSEVISSVKSMMYESPVPSLSLNEETVAVWMQEDEFDPQYTWVQDINNVELLGSFNSMLNESTSKLTQMPQLGDLCGKQFDGIWCRAKVVCLNPLTLFYIDYGNIEEVSSNEIKPLPPSLSKYPALAYRIKFPFGGKPKAESNECGKFTPVAFEDNVYSVTNVTMQT